MYFLSLKDKLINLENVSHIKMAKSGMHGSIVSFFVPVSTSCDEFGSLSQASVEHYVDGFEEAQIAWQKLVTKLTNIDWDRDLCRANNTGKNAKK